MADSVTEAPALPWGRLDARETETKPVLTDEDPPAAGLPLTDVGLAAGQKIEVRWQVDLEVEAEGAENNTAATGSQAATDVPAEGNQQGQQSRIHSSVRVGLTRHSMLPKPFRLLC
jgi:hypothetical protein